MKIIKREEAPRKLVDMDGAFGADMSIPIGVEDGSPTVSMRILTLIPGGHTPYHKHPFEHINYVMSGEGVVHTEDGPYWIEQGDCILIPPNVFHNYENLMSEEEEKNSELVFICVVPKEFECGCPDDEEEK